MRRGLHRRAVRRRGCPTLPLVQYRGMSIRGMLFGIKLDRARMLFAVAWGGCGNSKTHNASQQRGQKLCAVRDAKGRFRDIRTYECAHLTDLAHKSKAERRESGVRARKDKRAGSSRP